MVKLLKLKAKHQVFQAQAKLQEKITSFLYLWAISKFINQFGSFNLRGN